MWLDCKVAPEGGPAILLELIITSSHSFEGGAAKMASSKHAGSEPKAKQEKKTEASEDHGKPFKFTFVSVFAVSNTK